MRRTRSDRSYWIVSLLTVFGFAGSLIVSPVAYSVAPEGKGKGNAQANSNSSNGQGNQGNQGNQQAGQARGEGRAVGQNRAANVDRGSAAAQADRQHPQQARNARSRADRNSGVGQDETRVRSQRAQRSQNARGNGISGREAAQAHVQELHESLNRLERARWSFNPHDDRGQGNMGKVDMLDPYGFARDDRLEETGNRGRPIRVSESEVEEPLIEAPLNLADIVTVESIDPTVGYLLETIEWYESMIELYGEMYPWYADYLSSIVTSLQVQIDDYIVNPPDTYDAVLYYGDTVDYSLTFDAFEGLDLSTLQVTTQLVSTETVSVTGWAPNEDGIWEYFSTTYETGEVLAESTEDLALSEDGTFILSLDPSAELLNGGYFNGSQSVTTEVVVTITDTVSGESYTITLDQEIRLIDPYGIVYDTATGTPIAGALVTVHNADGSIVVLDKSANPNVNNPQMTDATGRYDCKLAIGKYYLAVKAPGYEDYKSPLFSEQGHIVRVDVALTSLASKTPSPAAFGSLTPAEAGFVAPLSGAGAGFSPLLTR